MVVGSDEIAHQLAAVREAEPRHCAVVLDRDRHAGEGPGVAWSDRRGCFKRTLAVDLDEGAELRIERLDALERKLGQLARADRAVADERRKLIDRLEHQLGGHSPRRLQAHR